MNPLSRAMKMVRLAKMKAASQEPTNKPPHPSEPMQRFRSSTPIPSDETEPDDSIIEDISLSELVVFNDANNVFTNQDVNKSMLNCYLPSVKDNILNRGNLVANVSLGSLCNDLALLDGAATVQEPVQAVDGTILQELGENTDIMDLDQQGCSDTSCGQQLEWESADQIIDDEDDNIDMERNLEGGTSSCQPIVEYQEATGSRHKSTAVDGQTTTDMAIAEHPLRDSSSNNDLSLLDAVLIDKKSLEAAGGITENIQVSVPQELDESAHIMDLDDRDIQDTSGSTTVDGQATGDVAGGEQQVHESSNDVKNTVAQEKEDETTPRSKKRKADKDKWKKNINKNKRAKGEAYLGRKYEKGSSKYMVSEKPAKLLGDRCSCKTVGVKCRDVTDETRQNIHKEVWAMSWPQRNVLVKLLVQRVPVGRRRVEQSDSNKSNTLKYHLNVGSGLVPVCKKMFISTTGMTQHMIRAQVCEAQNSDAQQPKTQGTSTNRVAIREFLKSLHTMPSHYCRKSSSKHYIEPVFNSKAEVHQEYKKWCGEKQITPSSRQVFVDEFDTGNYALFQPRKDQCDLCVSYSEGNVDEETYVLHRQRKEQAQKSKEDDKKAALASNATVKMLTMDLQSVLLAPSLKASALYYKTKLCVHNYTIYDAATKDVTCYVWHEVEGGLTANEFASCLCHHLSQDQTCKEYILFSDGCPYQNRNVTLSKALTLFAQKNGITITHKFLEKGHTQMEVDSVHHTIEAKLRNKLIYCPSDYVRYMTEARQKPFPYKVEYLSHTFFKDYTDVCALKSIRPGKKAGDSQVADIRCLQYTPDGRISYKLCHEGEWQELIVRGNSTLIQNDPKRLLPNKRKISASKYKHLQELKHVIPQDVHAFYDALPHD